jgi:riboflavin kinase/FMN adenylyltransferase
VYATLATVDGQVEPSVTNIGRRPTFGDAKGDIVETHLLAMERDLYGARLRLAFLRRLREERAFADADALREQVAADIRQARRLFDRISL